MVWVSAYPLEVEARAVGDKGAVDRLPLHRLYTVGARRRVRLLDALEGQSGGKVK